MLKKVLTIAGSDCSGGAGIQADIKTMCSHGVYAMSVITALTAQNTAGVYGIETCSPEFVANQLDCIFSDIPPDAVKIGMVANAAIINVIADKLVQYKAENIIVDPVAISTSGSRLIDGTAVSALVERLFPLAAVVTPNIHEAEMLAGMTIKTDSDMLISAQKIGGTVLVKGGHGFSAEAADDLLFQNGIAHWITGKRIDNPNTHGTGCTLSSAIACNLALGHDVLQSVINAKDYITKALTAMLDLGKGSGPLNHLVS